MGLIGRGKFHRYQNKAQLFIFSPVSNDSQFPLFDGDEVEIEIMPKNKEIRIRKASKGQRRL